MYVICTYIHTAGYLNIYSKIQVSYVEKLLGVTISNTL